METWLTHLLGDDEKAPHIVGTLGGGAGQLLTKVARNSQSLTAQDSRRTVADFVGRVGRKERPQNCEGEA